MEQRIPLSKGSVVQKFVVDQVIGYGAGCLVYEAHYLDGSNYRKEIILKECYPCSASATRVGNKIVWNNTEAQEKAFLRFNSAYDTAAKIQNVAGAKNVSVYSLDKLAENGTEYIITIPNGNSYDKDKSKEITDIIRTVLALTNAVGIYHKAGYLHLDIKPSNFIATEDQTGKGKNIVLFDVDSVVSLDDIKSGKLRSVSYSKECAAPEQKMQQIKKLCPATDLFAVGAILFEHIMNRSIECHDSDLFADWEFDNRLDANIVNPKAPKLLKTIFRKTLAANVKRRYQSAEELAVDLDELLSIVTDGKAYLISNVCHSVSVIGRNKEIQSIHEDFLSGKKVVFLHGVGGIGKSTVALGYADRYLDQYDTILFLRYRDSLEEIIDNIDIHNCDIVDKNEKQKVLHELLNENTLLIIDNFDVPTDKYENLQEMLPFNSNTRIIVTSRTDFHNIYGGEYKQNEILPLSHSSLVSLFTNSSECEYNNSEIDSLCKLFDHIENNTYVVYLLGKQIAASGYSIDQLADKVSTGLFRLSCAEKIKSNKDGKITKKTIPEIIHFLFDIAALSENYKLTLRNLHALRFLNIDAETYKQFTNEETVNDINDLVELGWVMKKNNGFSLHSLIEEVIAKEMPPCTENCKNLFIKMFSYILRVIDQESALNCRKNKRAITLWGYFCANLDLKINTNLQYSIDGLTWISSLLFCKTSHDSFYYVKDAISPLFSKIESLPNDTPFSIEQKCDYAYIIFAFELIDYIGDSVILNHFNAIYKYDSVPESFKIKMVEAERNENKYIEQRIQKLIKLIDQFDCYSIQLPVDKRKDYVNKICSLISNKHYFQSFEIALVNRINDFNPEFFCEDYSKIISSIKEEEKHPLEISVRFGEEQNSYLDTILMTLQNDNQSDYHKISYIQNFFEDILFISEEKQDASNINRLMDLLKHERKIINRNRSGFSVLFNGGKDKKTINASNYLNKHLIHCCAVFAAQNMLNSFLENIEKYLNYDTECIELQNLPFILHVYNKSEWLFSYLMNYLSSTKDNEIKRSCIERILNSLILCAKNAAEETEDHTKKEVYLKAAETYGKKLNRLQNVDFSFK